MLRKLFQRSCSLLESSSLGMSNVSASSVLLDARMAACARAFSDQPSSSSSAVGGSSSSSTPSTSSAISILSPEREELLKRVLGDSCKGGREIRKQRLNEVSERFKVHERDCGSPEFQISRLSADLALYSRLLSGNQRKNFRLKAHRQKMEHRQGKLLRSVVDRASSSLFFSRYQRPAFFLFASNSLPYPIFLLAARLGTSAAWTLAATTTRSRRSRCPIRTRP